MKISELSVAESEPSYEQLMLSDIIYNLYDPEEEEYATKKMTIYDLARALEEAIKQVHGLKVYIYEDSDGGGEISA